MKAYQPTTLVQEFVTRYTERFGALATNQTPEERTLWAICLHDARQIMDSYDLGDFAEMVRDGVKPTTIQGWLQTVYEDVVFEMYDNDWTAFQSVTEIPEDMVQYLPHTDDLVDMLLDTIKK